MSARNRKRFHPQRLTLARELRGLTKTELAAQIKKTPGAISHFESGRGNPDPTTIGALTLALGVPPEFLETPLGAPRLGLDDCNFRSLRSATQRERRRVIAFGTLLSEVEAVISEYVQLPLVNLEVAPLYDQESIEERATALRRRWGLGDGPIHEVFRLLERNGIIVALIPEACDDVDAFSCWQRGRPFVFVVAQKPPSRQRFDAAHELAHLHLHEDVIPGDRHHERHADSFAASFLMPKKGLMPHLRGMRSPTLEFFYELKSHWGVSAAALIRRSYDLGVLRETAYSRLFKALSVTGARKSEPAELVQATPCMLSRAVEQEPHLANELRLRVCVREADYAHLVRSHNRSLAQNPESAGEPT